MRRRHRGPGAAESSNERTTIYVSPLQQVLQFGDSQELRRNRQGANPPPLASTMASFLGAQGSARLGRCAVGWQRFVPTGLRGEDLQHWAKEHWPEKAEAASGTSTGPFWAATPSADIAAMLDQVYARVALTPQQLHETDPRGQLPLHVAARRGHPLMVQLLLDLHAEVDAVGQLDGRTALHCACAAGDAKCVKRLLAARADPQRRDQLRMLPLDVAARQRAEEAQEVLLAAMAPASSSCANTQGCCIS